MEVGLVYINFRSTDKIHLSIKSLQAFTDLSLEIFVGDNSGDYVSCCGERILCFGQNLGFGAAVNRCVNFLETEFVAIINPDTTFRSDILNASIQLFSLDNVGFVSASQINSLTGQLMPSFGALPNLYYSFFQILPYSLVPNFVVKNFWPLRELFLEENTFESCFGAFLFMSTRTFKSFNGFDEQFFLYYEETDFCKRLIMRGYRNYILDESHAYVHDIGYSARQVRKTSSFLHISRFKYFKKHHGFITAVIDSILTTLVLWKTILRR